MRVWKDILNLFTDQLKITSAPNLCIESRYFELTLNSLLQLPSISFYAIEISQLHPQRQKSGTKWHNTFSKNKCFSSLTFFLHLSYSDSSPVVSIGCRAECEKCDLRAALLRDDWGRVSIILLLKSSCLTLDIQLTLPSPRESVAMVMRYDII